MNISGKLPYSIRVLLESAVRNCDNFQVTDNDVKNILNWEVNQTDENGIEVAFKPARVILQVSKYITMTNLLFLYYRCQFEIITFF